jgi:disulfide oxidoreductase YuzD
MKNNKQQTAVEWLIEQLHRKYGGTDFFWTNMDEIEQAKEIEKEETIKFTEDWYFNGPLLGEGIDVKNTIEQHFNNTYGGGEQ